MKEIYHGVEIEVLKEVSHLGWTALYWSLTDVEEWKEIDADVEKDGSMVGLMRRLKERVDKDKMDKERREE